MNLIERIDHWAVVAPEAIAHISDGRTLTYWELRSRSNALACYLTQRFGDDHRPIAVLGEVFLNQAPFSFDLSVMDLYCCLTTAGSLFSISRDLLENPKKLYRALASSGVTTWVSTPSFAQMCLVEERFSEAMLPRVRRFLFCGETLAPQTAAQLLKRFPRAEVWNT